MRYSLLALTLLLTCTFAHGQAPAAAAKEPPALNVAMSLRCLSLPQTLAVPLIRRLRSGDAAEQAKAMTELEEMAISGKATLQGWLHMTTHSGQKTTVEDVEEIRYATEYEPAHINVYLADRDGKLTLQPDKVKTETEPVATAFDTRNVGFTLETEPIIAPDRKSLEMTLVAQHVRLKSVDRIVVEREFTTEKKTQKTIVEQPRFMTLKVQTQFTMQSGEQRLIGIFRGPEEKSVELFILGADVLESK